MATKKQTANTSGLTLWNFHEHKVGILEGLQINNQSANVQKIRLMDQFVTDASKTMAADAATAAEALGSGHPLSGLCRFEASVPAGEFLNFNEHDLKGIRFLGACAVIGSNQSSDCVVIAQYHPE